MAKFTEQHVVNALKESGLVPLFTHEDADIAKSAVEAAYRGGIRVFEFTNRRKNSFDVFVQLLDFCKKYPDLILGIGTVMDGETTEKFIGAGAHFIISPILKTSMADVCHRHAIPWIPGCATLTEIVTAKEHGAKVIKVFPGSVLGPAFVSSVLPVVPGLQLMITGGVEPTEASLLAWFRAGSMCVGMGSQLFTKEILETKNWSLLQQRIEEALAIIKKVKK